MQNIWVRLNAVIFFALSVLLGMAVLCSQSTMMHNDTAIIEELKLNTLKSLRNHGGVDRAVFSFDLKADLTPVWHWNTHVLFTFLVAEYTSDTNSLNQVVVWDKIIQYRNQTKLSEKNTFIKYALTDQSDSLRGKNISLKLYYDHMPITGRVYTIIDSNSSFVLPKKYKL